MLCKTSIAQCKETITILIWPTAWFLVSPYTFAIDEGTSSILLSKILKLAYEPPFLQAQDWRV